MMSGINVLISSYLAVTIALKLKMPIVTITVIVSVSQRMVCNRICRGGGCVGREGRCKGVCYCYGVRNYKHGQLPAIKLPF